MEAIKLRVSVPVEGLYQECQPECGKIYDGEYHKMENARGFAVIHVNGKKIILRDGEYETVKGAKDVKRPIEEAIEAREEEAAAKELRENTAIPKREREAIKKREREKRLETPTDESAAQESPARVPAADEDVFERLCEAQRYIYKLERALIRMALKLHK